MPRKRQEGLTTYARYKAKAYAVGMGLAFGNEQLAREYAEALTLSRAAGYGLYKIAYAEAKAKLMQLGVSSKWWGLIKAFVNELVHKCQVKKVATPDEIVDKWLKELRTMRDPEAVLKTIRDTVVQIFKTEPEKAAPKGA